MKWPGMHKWTSRDGIIVPKKFLKEEIDRVHREDWEDSDRYARQKQKALRYIEVRAKDIQDFDWERLVREVTRVFHDDLIRDADIKTAAQHACFTAELQWRRDQDLDCLPPEPATDQDDRGEVRGVDDREETLASLEWQRKEEETEP